MEAFVSGRAGVAILVDGDRLSSIRLEPLVAPTPCTTRDVRFLLGDARDVLVVEGETVDEIRAHLVVARAHDDALQLALFTLDAELSEETRRESALALEELLARDGVLPFIDGVLSSCPAPESADLVGAKRLAARAGAAGVEGLLEKIASSRSQIEAVRGAWDTLPDSFFGGTAERARVRAAFVRAGVFAALVTGDVAAAAAAIRRAARARTTDDYETMLQAWIRSLESGSWAPRRFRYESTDITKSVERKLDRELEARDGPRRPTVPHPSQRRSTKAHVQGVGRLPLDPDPTRIALRLADEATRYSALSECYDGWRSSLARLARRSGLSDPKQIVQDSFVHLMQRLHDGERIADPHAWLRKTVARLSVDSLEADGRREARFLPYVHQEGSTRAARAEGKQRRFFTFSFLEEVMRANTLDPGRFRTIRRKTDTYILSLFGLGSREIAWSLSLSASTVREHLQRGYTENERRDIFMNTGPVRSVLGAAELKALESRRDELRGKTSR
jgi:DNA-directed RNA polymerase specialized sigma24 family protein